jgi:threonyl-tRNA synthetase
MLVVGEKEQIAGTVAVRDRVEGDLGALPLAEFIAKITGEQQDKRIRQVSTANSGLADTGAKF